jgi:hypothetical protein
MNKILAIILGMILVFSPVLLIIGGQVYVYGFWFTGIMWLVAILLSICMVVGLYLLTEW